jgi:ADP-heptose:LPS heptosyltransferase
MELRKTKQLEGIQSITVLMFGLLGDVLIRTPVLRALKELYPDAKITVAADAIGEQILRNNPDCDAIIIVNRSKKDRLSYYLNKFVTIAKIRKSKMDLIVDLYNGGSSPMMVLSSSAKYRLGYKHQKNNFVYNIKSLYVPYANGVIDSFNHQVMSILNPISDKTFSLQPIFTIPRDVEENIRNYISQLNVDMKNVYVLNLGSGGEEKLLDNAIYFQAIEYIYKKYNLTPAIIQNPSQEYLQESLIKEHLENSGIPFIKLKALSLDEVGAFIAQSRFIITPDTGLMHLSFSLDSYVLALFTYTNPKLVDIGSKKFFPVFEHFEERELHKKQNITFELIQKSVDTLFEEIN